MYKELSQIDHILQRPDSYIGIVTNQTSNQFIYENGKIVNKLVTFNPGLLKLFDEALMNSRDHCLNDHGCDVIDVKFDESTSLLSIYNNG